MRPLLPLATALTCCVLSALAGCGNGDASAQRSASAPTSVQRSDNKGQEETDGQTLALAFQCRTVADYEHLDQVKTEVRRFHDAKGSLRLGVRNFLMICAETAQAAARFDHQSLTLAVDVTPAGLKHCLCEYDLDPMAIRVPAPARRRLEDYRLNLARIEAEERIGMFSARIGDIPFGTATP